MQRHHRGVSARAIGSILLLGACDASAAAQSTSLEPLSRYAVRGVRLERAAVVNSADGRFRLDPRLQSEPASARQAGDLIVRAQLRDATAIACSASDTVFANGYE